jgi:hypothetical protein
VIASSTLSALGWHHADTHHGPGHIARLNPRGSRGRVMGRHENLRPDVESAAYADRLRRSAGWTPKHLKDTP